MNRSTLARRRTQRFLRDPEEGGGGGQSGSTDNGGAGGEQNGGGSDGGGSGSGSGGGGSGAGESDRGYPEHTPLAEMSVEQREAYHRYHSRKWQGIAESRKDYDAVKAKADQFDELQRQQMTPSEKALDDARRQGREEERTAQAPRLVKAEFRAMAAGRTINGQPVDLDALLEDVDLTKYLKDDGDVDTAKVTARLDKLAPLQEGQGGGRQNGGQPSQQRHGAGGHRGTGAGKPDVTDTRNAMERALGRRPKANTGA